MSQEVVNPILPQFIEGLDKQFVEIYSKYQAPYLRADQVTIGEYRANPGKYTFQITPGPYPEVERTAIHKVKVEHPEGEIKVKVYTPTEGAVQAGGLKTSKGLPTHVNYHGGGWVIGGLQSDESWCRIASQTVGMIIVDVDYRLAPEYPLPTGVWDSWAALKWVFANASNLGIDPTRVSIGGLSAGGHIAAVLAILARDETNMPPLKLQLLVVPAVDHRYVPAEGPADPSVPYKTYQSCEFARNTRACNPIRSNTNRFQAPCLPLNRMRWFSRLSIGTDPDERKKKAEMWTISPILASSHANLAPCSIRCAEFDMLRDEAIAYNDLLNNSGTPSRIKVYKGVCHPFGHWDGELEKAKEYVRDTLDDLRQAHAINAS